MQKKIHIKIPEMAEKKITVAMQESITICNKDKKHHIAVSDHSTDNTKYNDIAKYALMRFNSPTKQPFDPMQFT